MSINTVHGWPRNCSRPECDAEECFYCGAFLSRRHEHDHFPIPVRAGGTDVVAACVNCHDLKDRLPLRDWSPSTAVCALQELLDVCAGPLPLAIADQPEVARGWMLGLVSALPDLHTSPRWQNLSAPSRILYAKMRFALAESSTPRARSSVAASDPKA
ncbi:MAG: HNH endonuclease [Mycolicibacterium sp.]|nr:HNH endonuclease [Mycolicibacterium sp.]